MEEMRCIFGWNHLEDLGIDEGIILELILKIKVGRGWTGFM
jgi:hypothetical protein